MSYQQVIQAYRAVLETGHKQYPIGMPDHILPFPAAEIKEAIRQQAKLLKTNNQLTEEKLEDLRLLYISLGKFVSGADAETVKAFRNATPSDEHKGNAGKSQRFQFITNKVRVQEEHYMQEFKTFYSRIGKGDAGVGL